MSFSRWDRVKELFDRALERPPDEWAAFLEEACDDSSVRADVEALLDAERNAPPFLEEGAGALGRPLLEAEEASAGHGGRHIGPYRLVERIGQGGMGVVYRAERVDGAFEQETAIKFLPRYFETETRVARFRAERQILADLDHPSIARLLDGGVTDEGMPYLVMEYVEGEPITTYAERHHLTIEERLGLLQTVLAAVQVAHANLVVHRDLKPSNILVAEGGQVKLLDFGIAKLLDAEAAPLTRTGRHPMTPGYAAPEQITGASITTATDIYQLGVLAYELLTGTRPFDLTDKRPSEIEQIVVEEAPTKPSTAVRQTEATSDDTARVPHKWARRLRGDLDTIILKALRKEPGRRYASAEAFADDLDRYLHERPVEACRATWRYRTRKFAQRNRRGIAGVGAALLLLIGLGVFHVDRLAVERDEARRQAAKAGEVSDFLVGLFDAGNPFADGSTDDMPTVEEVLDRGMSEADLLTDQPAVQAQMLEAIGRTKIGLGMYGAADSLLESSLDIRRAAFDAPHSDIAASYTYLGNARRHQGAYEDGEDFTRKALSMYEALGEASHEDAAESLHNLAVLVKEQGRYAEADSLYREALAMRRALHGDAHATVASTLTSLGEAQTEQGEYEEAETLHREALEINRAVHGPQHPETAYSLNNLARALEPQGRYAEAEALYREALRIKRDQLGDNHPQIATSLNNLAVVVEEQGNFEEAEALKREVLDRRKRMLGDDHPDVSTALNNLGVLYSKTDDHDQAAAAFREVLARHERTIGSDHPYVAFTKGSLARSLVYLEQYEDALRHAETSLAMIRDHFGDDHPRTASAHSILGHVHERSANHKTADSLYKEALAWRETALGEEHPSTASTLHRIAANHRRSGDCSAALPLYRAALDVRTHHFGEDDVRTAQSATGVGTCLVEQEAYAEAEPLLRQAYDALERAAPAGSEILPRAAAALARLYENNDRPGRAEEYRAAME